MKKGEGMSHIVPYVIELGDVCRSGHTLHTVRLIVWTADWSALCVVVMIFHINTLIRILHGSNGH